MPEPQRQVATRNYEAFMEYLPMKHKGNATLFISQSIVDKLNGTAMGWGKLIGDKLEVLYVPGEHASMMQPPNVESLAINIECLLERESSESQIKPTAKASDKR
jgi:thioesterase domain-containing protein